MFYLFLKNKVLVTTLPTPATLDPRWWQWRGGWRDYDVNWWGTRRGEGGKEEEEGREEDGEEEKKVEARGGGVGGGGYSHRNVPCSRQKRFSIFQERANTAPSWVAPPNLVSRVLYLVTSLKSQWCRVPFNSLSLISFSWTSTSIENEWLLWVFLSADR